MVKHPRLHDYKQIKKAKHHSLTIYSSDMIALLGVLFIKKLASAADIASFCDHPKEVAFKEETVRKVATEIFDQFRIRRRTSSGDE